MILSSEQVKEFVSKHPVYRDALIFRARKFKEDAYSRNENSKTIGGFPLANIIPEDEESYDEYAEVYVKLKIANLAELNDLVERNTRYMSELRDACSNFINEKISHKIVNGVFLTGGASRMNFIRPLISECFSLPIEKVKIDNDNPSLTISRGIALLGTTDAITSVLVAELRNKMPTLVNNHQILSKLIYALVENISDESWKVVESGCSYWVKFGKTTNEKELKELLERNLNYFQKNEVSSVINDTLHDFLKDSSEEIRKRMNEIISRYAPGREIAMVGNIQLGNIQAINNSLSDMSSTISQICDSISNMLADILWAALGVFLWGVFCAPYYLYKLLRSDESKRKDKAEKILEKRGEVLAKVKNKMRWELQNNTVFKNTVTTTLNNYFTQVIERNLQQVMIPIE